MTRSVIRRLIPEARLRARVRALAGRIRRDYRGKDPVLVGVLKGSFVFMADLARAIRLPVRCDFLRVSSYSGSRSRGAVRFEFDLTQPIEGKDVLLVEDVVDTGLTAQAVLGFLRAKKPRSLRFCTLLLKKGRMRVKLPVEYVGFRISNRFVVGYGLDLDGLYRNLPYVGTLHGEAGGI